MSTIIEFDFNKNCYGCKNCENICPTGAIKIVENNEGFMMPEIDKKKCISCGACDKKCPYINFKMKSDIKKDIWYSCYLKNTESRTKSTSGGIFPALVQYFLKNKGMICGCIWDEDMKPIHILTDDIKDIEKMRGSKYVQSDLKKVAIEIKNNIADRKILFTGTPCQVAAIKLMIGENENLFTCGLICEGVPSYKVWRKYADSLEKKYNSKMMKASFRDKEIGWDTPVAKYEFENKKIRKTLSFTYDRYVLGFLQGLYYRNSCNNCQYKGDGHNSDIIIGDLWGAKRELQKNAQYKGVSAVILNSDKAVKIFKEIQDTVFFEEIAPEKVIEKNRLLMEPILKNARRDKFFENIDKIDIVKNIEKNINKKQYENNIKEFLYKIKLFKLMKNLKNKRID